MLNISRSRMSPVYNLATAPFLRTSISLRGPERSTIYAAKEQHVLAMETRSRETIWKSKRRQMKTELHIRPIDVAMT